MSNAISFSAVGDCFITRPSPINSSSQKEIFEILHGTDARFANLECVLINSETYSSAISGGTWAAASPEVLKTIQSFCINLIGWANNHTLDYLHNGLLSTQKHLDKHGFIHAGAGNNLRQASAPKYLECSSARIALIAAASSAPNDWIAGDQRTDCIGRPGLNLLRYETQYKVDRKSLRFLKSIAGAVNINFDNDLSIRDGFLIAPENDVFNFGNHKFIESNDFGKITIPNQVDMIRIINSIKEAKRRSDYVLISIHSHENNGESIDQPADFFVAFAHECIDNGADAVIGHGPHVTRGIEIYKDKPIFYSLGNFIYQPETVTHQPSDMYEKYGLGSQHNVADALYAMSANYTRGHTTISEMWESVLPVWTMTNGKIEEINLYPIELGYGLPIHRMGSPMLSKNVKIIERIKRLSEFFGVDIICENGIGKVIVN